MFKLFKQNINVEPTYFERLAKVESEVTLLKAKINGLELENDNLRDKVLRKIQKKKEQESDEVTPEKKSVAIGGAYY